MVFLAANSGGGGSRTAGAAAQTGLEVAECGLVLDEDDDFAARRRRARAAGDADGACVLQVAALAGDDEIEQFVDLLVKLDVSHDRLF
jgi:hypothetical protein